MGKVVSASFRRVSLTLSVALLAACGSGTLDPSRDSGLDSGDSGFDSDVVLPPIDCTSVECPPGYECIDGVCYVFDACADIVCPNPGEVCSGGVCIPGEADTDGDGVIAAEDCDDTNPTVYPDAPEVCRIAH